MAAVYSLQSQRELLLNLIRHCLLSVSNSLWTKQLISQDVRESISNNFIGSNQRSVLLLQCIEAKIKTDPSAYVHVIDILESEPFLESLAGELVRSYCESH